MPDIMPSISVFELIGMLNTIAEGYTDEELRQMPVFLGDDEELNGFHSLYNCEEVDRKTLEILNWRDLSPVPGSGISLLLS